MRRSVFTLTVLGLALAAGVVAAQEVGLVAKGIKAGLAMSSFTGDDKEYEGVEPGTRMGLAAGGFLTFALGPNFALQPEALYVMKGAKYEEGGDELTIKLNYIDIPVLLKYRFTAAGSTRPCLFAGPVASIKASAKAKSDFGGVEEEEDMSDEVKSLDFGIALGGGLDFAMASSTVTFDVRYTLGLTDWVDDLGDEDVVVKNSGWLVTLGIGF